MEANKTRYLVKFRHFNWNTLYEVVIEATNDMAALAIAANKLNLKARYFKNDGWKFWRQCLGPEGRYKDKFILNQIMVIEEAENRKINNQRFSWAELNRIGWN